MRSIDRGFIPDVIYPEDYVFGSGQLRSEMLQPGGQWDEYLPSDELQKRNGLETMNCTVYGTLNCLEILLKRKYGIDENFSERYVGIAAGTTTAGNSPTRPSASRNSSRERCTTPRSEPRCTHGTRKTAARHTKPTHPGGIITGSPYMGTSMAYIGRSLITTMTRGSS